MPLFTMQPAIGREAVFREIGYKDTAGIDCSVVDEITAAIEEFRAAMKPKVVYAEYPVIADKSTERLALPKGNFSPGPRIFQCLSQADTLIVAVATLGDLTKADTHTPDDLFTVFLQDAIGTVGLLELQDSFWRSQARKAARMGGGLTGLFCPGDGEWGIEDQGSLFANVDAAAIEVGINRRFLMTPLKSVSMVCGAGVKIKTPRTGHRCGDCSRTTCSRRICAD